MSVRPPSLILLTIASFLLAAPTLASADDNAARKKLVACINKDISAANSDWKLSSADLKRFTDIVDRELMKAPFLKRNSEEKARVVDGIHSAARKDLPSLSSKMVDQMIDTLKVKGMHCSSLLEKA